MKKNVKKLVLKLTNVNIGYKKNLPILKNVNLSIYQGESVYIVGYNGIGKSSLMKVMCGLLKPQVGEVTYNDVNCTQMSYVSQVLHYKQDLRMSDLIKLATLIHGLSVKQIITSDVYRKFKLHKFYDSKMNELSLGIQKQINLLLAIVWKPSILFLDEFATNLDPKITNKILMILKTFCKVNKITLIAISHYMAEIKFMNASIISIQGNKILFKH